MQILGKTTVNLILFIKFFLLGISLIFSTCGSISFAGTRCLPSLELPQINKNCGGNCCDQMGGISYCDSSSGRFVCNNGFQSSCYCTRHAIMDIESIQGCCTWQGGVMAINPQGIVVCNDGGASEICTRLQIEQQASVY